MISSGVGMEFDMLMGCCVGYEKFVDAFLCNVFV